MTGPDSVSGFLSLLFGLMGGGFALIAAPLAAAFPQSARGSLSPTETALVFLSLGGTFLLVSALCGWRARRRKRRWKRLRAEGRKVQGWVTEVRCHSCLSLGISRDWRGTGMDRIPFRRSPYDVRCRYTWAGETYTCTSPLLWDRPLQGQTVDVYLEEDRPERAFVDPDTVMVERRI